MRIALRGEYLAFGMLVDGSVRVCGWAFLSRRDAIYEGITMFWKKKKAEPPVEEAPKEKPTPAFLRDDYPYKAIGDAITDLNEVQDGVVYEIKCHQCEMSIRSQGQNIRSTYERIKDKGCIGCGNKDLKIYKVDMSKAPKREEKAPES